MAELRPILLVDDDESLRRVVEYQLTEAGHTVTSTDSGADALERLRGGRFRLVLSDVIMPGMNGLELVDRARVLHPATAFVVITAHGDVATAVRAMQLGALDFLEKPFTRERLLVAVEKALDYVALGDENRRLRALVQERGSFEKIIGSSPAIGRMLSDLELAAASDATVLILGESGTGKELAARALHRNSARREGPFVVVNCAAIPETLIESELFGHRRGSFTGATEDRKGKFEQAHGGTLLLDEVAELPLALQPRLLRAVQHGEVDKLGSPQPVLVDVRVLAATNRDLASAVAEGSFREDLYYRLNVVPLRVPPLRERLEDLPVLVEHFLLEHARRHGRPVPELDPGVLDRFERHPWPGNVRELENLLERLVVLSRSAKLTVDALPETLARELPRYGGAHIELPPTGVVLEEVERGLIEEALRRSAGTQSQAARFLGISRQTLVYRMKKFGFR